MTQALLLVALFGGVIVSAIVAQRLRVPYPIAFVAIGLLFAFVPGVSVPQLDPQLMFTLVLPPLLFSGGWSTDWFDFKRNFQAIVLLAVGLVIATTLVVAALAHGLGGFGWAMAFVLGAIVSPPDAVASEAIFERMAVPRRIVAIVTGEGLVNDGTALVLYRFAIAAALAGTFSLAHASGAFVLNVLGGTFIGLVLGIVFGWIQRIVAIGVDDAAVTNVVGLLTPYVAYIVADELGVSGVLSVVAAGIYLSRHSQQIFDAEGRVIASSFWTVVILLLNGFVFLQIGLTLPAVVRSLPSLRDYIGIAIAVSVAVILVRFIWVYPVAWLRRKIPGVAKRDPLPDPRSLFIIGWSGMRGIVSLAAALALPYFTAGGASFPDRSGIVFITICVIAVTLLLHGLTLGPLIRFFGIGETSGRQAQEIAIRLQALEAGTAYLKSIEATLTESNEIESFGRLLGEYERRIEHLRGHLADDAALEREEQDEREADRRLEEATLDAERREIARLRRSGAIPDDIYQAIAYDLDLAGLRLH